MSLNTSQPPRQIGNYDILLKIADGGMGSVYKARNRTTGEIVAVKIIPAETARNPLLLKRFEQEFKAASLIDHPNVVKALDYCGTGATPFLVMEFVDGETLGQRVERTGPIPEAEAVNLIGQVCEGLHRAHKQGLIHRDVKPDNVMVTADGMVKLTDLGLVKDVEGEQNLTRTGRGLGTPHFMAPEQFRNAKNADVRCDVYSLGATLYMMVTGEVPFNKTTPLDCWIRKTKNEFPQPKALVRGLSERINWAICRAMHAKPDERPASCREFMEDLTGAGWRAPSGTRPAAPLPAGPALAGADDLWYMVYKDEVGGSKTVKGTTDSIRRNIQAGALGDLNAILVSRTKTGQFVPLRSVPEFRDMILGAATPSSITYPSSKLHTDHDPAAPPAKLQTGGSKPAPPYSDITTYHPPVPDGLKASVIPKPGRQPDPDAPRRTEWVQWAALIVAVIAAGVGLVFVFQ
jgi:serine/threonine protein kinase